MIYLLSSCTAYTYMYNYETYIQKSKSRVYSSALDPICRLEESSEPVAVNTSLFQAHRSYFYPFPISYNLKGSLLISVMLPFLRTTIRHGYTNL